MSLVCFGTDSSDTDAHVQYKYDVMGPVIIILLHRALLDSPTHILQASNNLSPIRPYIVSLSKAREVQCNYIRIYICINVHNLHVNVGKGQI